MLFLTISIKVIAKDCKTIFLLRLQIVHLYQVVNLMG